MGGGGKRVLGDKKGRSEGENRGNRRKEEEWEVGGRKVEKKNRLLCRRRCGQGQGRERAKKR